jgi:hypothetical protein
MLDKLRADAIALIAATPSCTLSTSGPAGVQASIIACAVRDACVYVLVPSTADHLFNLEHEAELVLTSSLWQLRGIALILGEAGGPRGTAPSELRTHAQREGLRLVEVFPTRMHIEAGGQRAYRETIDFNLQPQFPGLALCMDLL